MDSTEAIKWLELPKQKNIEFDDYSEDTKEIREEATRRFQKALSLGIEALENQKSIIEELERYKKMYSKLKKSKNKLKKTIQDNILKNELFIRAYYLDSTSGFIIETQKIIDSHFDKYIKENKE